MTSMIYSGGLEHSTNYRPPELNLIHKPNALIIFARIPSLAIDIMRNRLHFKKEKIIYQGLFQLI